MRFIELHYSDGKPMLVNLDDIADIRPSTEGGDTVVINWRGGKHADMSLTVKESYKDIRGSLIRAGVVTV